MLDVCHRSCCRSVDTRCCLEDRTPSSEMLLTTLSVVGMSQGGGEELGRRWRVGAGPSRKSEGSSRVKIPENIQQRSMRWRNKTVRMGHGSTCSNQYAVGLVDFSDHMYLGQCL